ncbi:MAG: helical backbone metal receptor [Planctomycetaceae bacterium]|jgi:iron complex transport system substrate-binding protein|nr:helical backbone metal receptor [Planctomycetaceae bacterium]
MLKIYFDSLVTKTAGNLGFLSGKIIIWAIVVILVVGCNATQNNDKQNLTSDKSDAQSIERIISVTPAITELLFDIGLGGKIVGDSQFTTYPPEAAKIEKIGGLYDRNNEKIISLKPDLVIFPIEDVQFGQKLKQFNIKGLSVDHRSISGLLESYELVGKLLGGAYLDKAIAKRRALEEFLRECKLQVEGIKRLKVLTVIDRQRGTGKIDNIFIAGAELFFSEVLSLAGGENVASGLGVAYPNISTEAIIDFNPDVIIDIQIHNEKDKETTDNLLRSDWDVLKDVVPTVKRGNVFIISDSYASIPGPRTPLLIKRIREILDSCRETK